MPESKFRLFLDAIKNLGNRNVLSPLVTLTFLVVLPVFYYLAENDIAGATFFFFCLMAAGVVASTVIAFFIILFRNPEELGSEDYRLKTKELGLRKQALDLIEQKGENIPLEPTSIKAISEPYSLEGPKEERG